MKHRVGLESQRQDLEQRGRALAGRFLREERGAIFVWFAVSLLMLLAVMSLAIDIPYAYFTRAKLQTTASSAALAGVMKLERNPADVDDMRQAVIDEALLYGQDKNQGLGHAGTVLDQADIIIGNWDPVRPRATRFIGEDDGAFDENTMVRNAVQATTRRAAQSGNPLELFIGTVLSQTDVNTSAIATSFGGGDEGPACILVLDPSAGDALVFNGGIDIRSENCGICVNSSNSSAVDNNNGDVNLDTNKNDDLAGTINFHGDVKKKPAGGQGSTSFDPPARINGPVCEDPYANQGLFATQFNNHNCSQDAGFNANSNPVVIPPGVHCGTTRITGNKDIILQSGIHHFINGSLDTGGNGTVTGTEVTILLTGSNFDSGGQRTLT